MGDSDKKESGPVAATAEQQEKALAIDDAHRESESAQRPTLDHARRFLQDEAVRKAPREEKIEFLRSKGIDEADIQILLDEEDSKTAQSVVTVKSKEPAPAQAGAAAAQLSESTDELTTDHAPIVTYPEFLARRQRPPPLITASGFLNTASAFAGIATLVYGASKYVLAPMVSSLTDARIDLHEHAAKGLGAIVSKLEDTVSEIPVTTITSSRAGGGAVENTSSGDGDTVSSCGDPTEVFHRDIGVQTMSPPLTPSRGLGASLPAATPTESQARRVAGLVASLKEVNRGIVSESEEYEDVKTVLDLFKDDLDRMSRPHGHYGGRNYSIYGSSSRQEPDDEIKAVKENIRRVKGVLLSARSFPAASR